MYTNLNFRNLYIFCVYIIFISMHYATEEISLTSRLASFPGSSAPERGIEVVHACTFRVPESLGTRLHLGSI